MAKERASLVAQMVKNLPEMQEGDLSSIPGLGNLLEEEMATHPGFLPVESQGLGAWWAAVYGVAQSQTRLK